MVFGVLELQLGETDRGWLIGFSVDELMPGCGMPEHVIVAFALGTFEKWRSVSGDHCEAVASRSFLIGAFGTAVNGVGVSREDLATSGASFRFIKWLHGIYGR